MDKWEEAINSIANMVSEKDVERFKEDVKNYDFEEVLELHFPNLNATETFNAFNENIKLKYSSLDEIKNKLWRNFMNFSTTNRLFVENEQNGTFRLIQLPDKSIDPQDLEKFINLVALTNMDDLDDNVIDIYIKLLQTIKNRNKMP